MDIKLVVFNLAATAVKDNKEVQLALQKAFESEGIDLTLEELDSVAGIPEVVAIKTILIGKLDEEFTLEDVENVHQNYIHELVSFYKYDPRVIENVGVSETFRILKENNIKVAIDTGFNKQIAEALLARLNWVKDGLVDVTVTADDVENGRPFPDMIFKAMELAGIEEVTKVAKVGDTPFDLIEGTSAGCGLVVGVTTGNYSEEDLMTPKHKVIISEVPELLEVLKIKNNIYV